MARHPQGPLFLSRRLPHAWERRVILFIFQDSLGQNVYISYNVLKNMSSWLSVNLPWTATTTNNNVIRIIIAPAW